MDGSDEGPSALLRTGREAFRPDAADEQRVLRALSEALGDPSLLEPDAGAVADQGAASASGGGTTASWTVAHKWLLGCVAAGVLAAGWTVAWPRAVRHTPPASAPVRSADGIEPPVALPPPEQAAPSARAEPAADVAPTARASGSRARDSLRAEVRLLARAQRELNAARPLRALRTLDEHARRFPSGLLTEERMAARIHALCTLGRTDLARGETEQFSRAYPGSAQLPRLRSVCGHEADASLP